MGWLAVTLPVSAILNVDIAHFMHVPKELGEHGICFTNVLRLLGLRVRFVSDLDVEVEAALFLL